jgi:hypothetical protein
MGEENENFRSGSAEFELKQRGQELKKQGAAVSPGAP